MMKKKERITRAIDTEPNNIISEIESPGSVVSATEYTGMLATIPEEREGMLALRTILPTPSASVTTSKSASQHKKPAKSKPKPQQ